jgi:nucleoside-triphosphatase
MLTLIEARPAAGKTTTMQRLAELLLERDMTLAGFVTEEIREGRRRVGFSIKTLGGESGTLAHHKLPGPPSVGRYGVDVGEFERLALPTLRVPADAILIDELGKMELASIAFRDAVADLVERDTPVVATVHAFRHPFTDSLKTRPDAEVVHLTRQNRDELPRRLAQKLAPADNEQRAT